MNKEQDGPQDSRIDHFLALTETLYDLEVQVADTKAAIRETLISLGNSVYGDIDAALEVLDAIDSSAGPGAFDFGNACGFTASKLRHYRRLKMWKRGDVRSGEFPITDSRSLPPKTIRCVYGLYSATGELVYVGRTTHLYPRLKSHWKEKCEHIASWGCFVFDTDFEMYDTEARIIQGERPRLNIKIEQRPVKG